MTLLLHLPIVANLRVARITLLSVASFIFRFKPIPNLDFNIITLVTAYAAARKLATKGKCSKSTNNLTFDKFRALFLGYLRF